MSIAKKAVDSTIRRILVYTAEIIASIFLLIIICLPLAFIVPMWIQRVALDTPIAELWVNPVAWFGSFGTFLVTLGLAIASLIIGYPYVMKLIPGKVKEVEPTSEEVSDEEDEEEETEEDEIEETTEEVELVEDEEVVEDTDEYEDTISEEEDETEE